MAITLASVPDAGPVMQALILALVGIVITAGVYGVVALIVKADDVGLWLAGRPLRTPIDRTFRLLGHSLVKGMPYLLKLLGAVGTAAMIWVGGGILVHGAEIFGFSAPAHALHDAGEAAARALPAIDGLVSWLVQAAGSGIIGLFAGAILIPIVSRAIAPFWRWLSGRLRKLRTA